MTCLYTNMTEEAWSEQVLEMCVLHLEHIISVIRSTSEHDTATRNAAGGALCRIL